MLKGEVAVLKMKPELHYGEDDCPVSVSDSFPKDAELNFEIELIEFSKIMAVTEDLGILKKVINEAQSWENPRDLYEVKARQWLISEFQPRRGTDNHFNYLRLANQSCSHLENPRYLKVFKWVSEQCHGERKQ
ncbi:peptidyl-prolyl cis-trans isomerase PASTICCINO1 isoform X2 [Helianthus annuus]|uniref:peptidyl-prolyl cis-trans isomerase PASTICCINO1 isoform X2 n=1 Tax=Helianthus annuus TaxID=4232 RepID=UPI001652BE17|nr:peptidyl-prolyl cis-trans isomerase PASTICCINO1 isoform X2 [Helianthus annuus]